MSNIVKITYGQDQTCPIFQWDYGQILTFEGFGDLLPDVGFETHFACVGDLSSVTSIGTAEGVDIPDALLQVGLPVIVWIYLHDTETDGETEYRFTIPIVRRAEPDNETPTPEQADVIDQAIAALQAGVARAEASAASSAANATLSRSWAVGGTGTRTGEDEDNSRYYAGQAAQSAESAAGSAETATGAASAASGSAGDAQRYAQSARDNASAAALSAIAADQSADLEEHAATNAGYMEIEINSVGHLIYTRTDAVDVDFSLNEYGYLVMEAIV